MKYLFLIGFFIGSCAWAGQYRYTDPHLNDELESIYKEIRDGQISTQNIRGTTASDSAVAGRVGESVSSVVTGNCTTTGQFGDLTSISLTPGDWDVSLISDIDGVANFTSVRFGISATSGNSATGLTVGDNEVFPIMSASFDTVTSIPTYRVSIAVTTPYYFKLRCDYSGTTPTAHGRLSARRLR